MANPTQAQIDKLTVNAQRWDDIINLGPNETVILDNGVVVKTIQGYLDELKIYNTRGPWATGTSYNVKDVVSENNLAYVCLVDHTSGTFSTDLSAGKWAIYQIDFTSPLELFDDLLIQYGGKIVLNQGGGSNNYIISGPTSASDLEIYTASVKRMSIDYATGNVAIGAEEPTGYKFFVTSTGPYLQEYYRAVELNNSSAGVYTTYNYISNGVKQTRARIEAVGLSPASGNGGEIRFITANESNVLEERFRVGRRSVNTMSPLKVNSLDFPESALDVAGNVRTLSTNSIRMVEVSSVNDLPTPNASGWIYLQANTTYKIKGLVAIGDNRIVITNAGITIQGDDPNRDILSFTTGTTDGVYLREGIAIIDQSVFFKNVGFTNTSASTTSKVFRAVNYTDGAYNQGREKFLNFTGCNFIDCLSIGDVVGFDLVEFNNCTLQYVKQDSTSASSLNIYSTSKLQISSCEFIRWFDRSTLPTPSGYALDAMLYIGDNAGPTFYPTANSPGLGAVNISGCVFHPQQTQHAIYFETGSTVSFGTIASNTFVLVGLTTGAIFNKDYNDPSLLNFDIKGNQGVLDSTGVGFSSFSGNTTNTALTLNTPAPINTGGLATPRITTRFGASTDMILTYIGSKKIICDITVDLSCEKQGGGQAIYKAAIYRNSGSGFVELPDSDVLNLTDSGFEFGFNMSYTLEVNPGDAFQIYVTNTTDNDDLEVNSARFIIKE